MYATFSLLICLLLNIKDLRMLRICWLHLSCASCKYCN